jgi:acetylornithine deacetylase
MMALTDAELLRRLVRFDTTSSRSNIPLAEFIADYLGGSYVEVLPSADEMKANLIAWSEGFGDSRDGLILSGHMDTVPATEPEWESDPFELRELDDRYVARGAADMKGFLAVAINTFIRARSTPLHAPLALLLTFDEEVGCLGSKAFVESWGEGGLLPRNAIIGEPTSLRVVRMHKGHLKLRVGTRGRSAHSGYPHLGDNAIEKAGVAIEGLTRLRRELERERPAHSEHFPDVPYVALNVATIHGGTAVNIIPDSCEIEVGVRLLPGMESPGTIDRVRSAIGGADSEVISESPPFLLDESSPICREMYAMLQQTETRSVNFASDAGWFQTLGIDCVLFGPGSIEVAHRPNEFVPKSDLVETPRLLDQAIDIFCRRR